MFESLIKSNTKQPEFRNVHFKGFPLGLNTSVPSEMLRPEELSSCVDLKINPGGQLETRRPFQRLTTTAASGDIKYQTEAILSGTSYSLASDDTGKIYYLDGADFTVIDTLTSGQAAFLFPYNDICYVLDGGYAKYLDDTSSVKIIYDAGDGGIQYDELTGNEAEDGDAIALGNGTNTRVATKFTSQDWETGLTIPITEVGVKLKATGSPTGTITCKLRKVSDDSILASKDFSEDASEISSEGETCIVIFEDSDVTTEMSSDTDYYCSIEHSGGDASNYIDVVCLSSGSAGYSYDGTWTSESKDPVMRIHPSVGPKAASGCVSKNRPWLAEDPDNPGYVWYGNLSAFDYSSENGGGYISTVDENRNSYPVGAIADLYGDLWIYGTEKHPFLCKLQGSSPSNFALPLAFQAPWATHNLLVNVGNDLLNITNNGVDSISGVQQYGDIRTFSLSDRINNIISENWSDLAFSKHNPHEGQIWVYIPGYEKFLIGNILSKVKDPVTGFLTFPWNEYSIPTGLTPTSFGYINKKFVFASGGHLYYLDSSSYKDMTSDGSEEHIWPEFTTAYTNFPFRTVDLQQIFIISNSITGGQVDISFFKNGYKYEAILTKSLQIALNDNITIDDLTMAIDDMYFSLDPNLSPTWKYININCWSVMLKFSQIHIMRKPIYFNEIVLSFEGKEK